MANNYTQFSTAFSLPTWESQDAAMNMAEHLFEKSEEGEGLRPEVPAELRESIEQCGWGNTVVVDGSDTPGIVIYSDECGNAEAAAYYLQWLIKSFCPWWTAQLTWAETCSAPRVNEFGGGAAFITGSEIKWFSAYEWLEQQVKQWADSPSGSFVNGGGK